MTDQATKSTSDYLIDDFAVTVKPGDPYRLLPFGVIVKNGHRREITPEYAARFRLPHFRPPVKLGSHEETTPAGGQIASLEVREDGLYAVPEFTEKGARAMTDGDYRYHSPEIIWEDGGLEDPDTGEIIAGPLIVGDALLHTPHLGESTALYSIEPTNNPIQGGDQVSDETVTVSKNIWDKIAAFFRGEQEASDAAPVEPPAPELNTAEPVVVKTEAIKPDEFAALQAKAAALSAEVDALKADKANADLHAAIGSEFDKADFGAAFQALKGEAVPVLADMQPEQRAWVIERFRALSAQINEAALVSNAGKATDQKASGPHEAITAYMTANSVDYVAAFDAVRKATPELFIKKEGI